jgi:hypothetical protein
VEQMTEAEVRRGTAPKLDDLAPEFVTALPLDLDKETKTG